MRKKKDKDILYIRFLQVFWVLPFFGVLCPVKFVKHNNLLSSAILVGLVCLHSCELYTLLKEEEVEVEKEQEEEKIEEKRRQALEMQDVLMVEECLMVNFPLYPFPLVSFICSSCWKVLPTKKTLKKNKTQHNSPSITKLLLARIILSGTALCTFYHASPVRSLKKDF